MIQSFTNYIKGSIDELKKVTWPTKEETIWYSIIVIIATIVSVGVLTIVDYGLSALVDFLLTT